MKVRRLFAMLGAVVFAVIFAGVGVAHAGGLWTISDAATNRCLDSNYSGNIYTLPCNGGNYQNWNQIQQKNGSYILQDRQTGLCLLIFANGVRMGGCSSAATDPSYLWYEYGGDYGTIFKNQGYGAVLDSNAAGNVYSSPDWARGNMYQNWY